MQHPISYKGGSIIVYIYNKEESHNITRELFLLHCLCVTLPISSGIKRRDSLMFYVILSQDCLFLTEYIVTRKIPIQVPFTATEC